MKKLIALAAIIISFLVSCKNEVYYSIITKVQPEGAGSVAVSPSSDQVQEGASVTFTAKPNGDYVFSGWSGSLSGTENPKTVTASSNLNVMANFTLRSYPLTITVEGEGSVTEKIISTKADYSSGTTVELTALPAEHWLFDHWEGDLNGNTNPAQITVTSAKSVKAVFVKKMYDLTIETQGEGSVSEKVVETKSSYLEGTLVELTATPNTYWAFDHWEGDITGTENPALITISDTASVKAVFVGHDPGIVFTETEYVSPYEINLKLGMGINMSCQLDAYREDGDHIVVDETYWGNPICTQQYFDKLAASGFKSVRIPITWMGTYGPAPDYIIDEDRLNRIAEVVGYAERAGLNAIINMHHDDAYPHQENDGHSHIDDFWINPEKAATDPSYNMRVKEQLKAMWTQIARKFRDKGDFLIFESFNEPGSGFFWSWATDAEKDAHQAEYNCLSEWNQVFVDAVRSTGGNNASRWLFVVGAAAKERNLDRLVIPKDYVSNNRIVLAIHFWEPESYVAGGFDEWGHTASIFDEELERFDETFISKELALYREKYLDKGIPICIDEMGSFMRDSERGKAFQLYYLEYLVRAASLNGLSTFIWDDGARDGNIRGFYIFWHDTGDYFEYSKEIVETVINAAYSTDQDYTLQSIYDNAPYADEFDDSVVIIPDPVFEKYVLQNYDRNHDGCLSAREALVIQEIEIGTDNVSTLQGVERFVNLRRLIVNGSSAGKGKLTALNLAKNTQLETLTFINNAVADLDISGCNKLKIIECWSNNLSSLDVSHLSELRVLSCAQNQIPSLDLANCTNLRELAINDNLLESVDVSSLFQLEILECGGNKLKELDVSHCPILKQLITRNTHTLTKIILSEGQIIESVEKDSHTSICVSEGIAICDGEFERYLLDNYDSNQDGKLSIAEATEIRDVNVSTLNIRTVQALRHASSLTTLVANGEWKKQGKLTLLDMSYNPELKQLSFLENNVSLLDISNCSQLVEILCWGNNLSELDLSNCPDLEVLCCAQNNLTSLDISKCPKLRVFAPNENDLEELDLSNNPLLEEVEIYNNPRLKVVWLKTGQTITHFMKDAFTEVRYKD